MSVGCARCRFDWLDDFRFQGLHRRYVNKLLRLFRRPLQPHFDQQFSELRDQFVLLLIEIRGDFVKLPARRLGSLDTFGGGRHLFVSGLFTGGGLLFLVNFRPTRIPVARFGLEGCKGIGIYTFFTLPREGEVFCFRLE